MSLTESLFSGGIVPNLLVTDLRNERPVLDVLLSSQTSLDVKKRVIGMGGSGGFAKQITFPLLKQHALNPTDGYSTETNFPSGTVVNPDLSSAYPESTDTPIIFDTNKVLIGTHFIPDMRSWTYGAGEFLQSAEVAANLDEIGDQLESAAFSIMRSATAFETASTSTRFNLDTSDEAALNADFKLLHGEFNRQNIPRQGRYIALPTTAEGAVLQWASLKSRDYVDSVSGDARTATWAEYAGFRLLFTNNMDAGNAQAFSTVRFAMILPKGIVVESMRDKDFIGDYTRLYGMFGAGSTSELITDASGGTNPGNTQRVGLVSLALT